MNLTIGSRAAEDDDPCEDDPDAGIQEGDLKQRYEQTGVTDLQGRA